MLDPITALSVAGVVVQLVEIGLKVVSKGSQISRSADGALAENIEVEKVTDDLLMLTTRLAPSNTPSPDNNGGTLDEKALEEMAAGCKAVASELLEALQQLKTRPGEGKWKSYRQALKSVMSKGKLDDLAKRLSMYREELQLHVLVSLRDTINIIGLNQAQGLDRLDKNTQALALLLCEQRDRPRIEYDNLTFTIISEHNHTREVVLQGNAQIIREIREATGRPWDKAHTTLSGRYVDSADAKSSTDLLDALAFPGMWNRQEQVAEAYAKTFSWIFEDPRADTRPWASFTHWLKDLSGKIYWINGKAGSGKSTLMKFLYDDPRTHALLKTWAGELPLIVVGHFFWNSGGDVLQMSQKGLLRVLLYKVLNKHRGLIPIVLPGHDFSADMKSWSLSKLQKTFDILATQQAVQVKLCFFVDGLDEYDDNYADLVEIFQRHANSPNVKFCVSSRPLLVFDDCLGGYPGLRLQDLTHEDICMVVSERLAKNKRMLALTLEEPEKSSKLISDIVDKADGVFLWVDLVVSSLLSGLQDHNHLSDLQKRVDVLPSKLEDLYEHMLNIIDPYYRPESSRIFQLFRAAGNFIEAIDLYLANQENVELALSSSIDPKPIEEIGRMIDNMDALLRTRCAGLLEYQDAGSQETHKRLKSSVVYIHRTARDFLEQPKIWSRIESWSGHSPCDPWILLLGRCVLRLKFISRNTISSNDEQSWLKDTINLTPWKVIDDALEFASHGTQEMLASRILLLDEIDKTMVIHWRTTKMKGYDGWVLSCNISPEDSWTGSIFAIRSSYNHQSSMLSLAVQAGLLEYVKDKTKHDITLIKEKPGRPLLDYALNREQVWELASEEMVAYLLTHGATPNQHSEPVDKTIWENFLRLFAINVEDLSSSATTIFDGHAGGFGGFMLEWIRIFTLLVQHGADPNVFCEVGKGVESSYAGYGSALEILSTEVQGGLKRWFRFQSMRVHNTERDEMRIIPKELTEAISHLQNLLVAKGAKAKFIKKENRNQRRYTNSKEGPTRKLSGFKRLFRFSQAK